MEMTVQNQLSDNETARPARAVIYLRVSTERQARSGGEAEGYSIPAQREVCRRKAEALGAEVVAEYIDAGASAKTADRDGLQELLARLEAQGDVDHVIVHKLDRLARSRMDDVLIVAAIQRAGAQLVSCTENLDETPQGKLLHGIMASMAEFYSQNLASEAKKGLHEKAKRGGTPGPAPVGYLNSTTRVEGIEVKAVVLDEERAHHVLWAYQSYATGQWSLSELTEELERRGFKSRPTRRYAGRPLNRSQVHRLLSNRYYLGKVHYGGVTYQGRHPALVSDELYQAVQFELARRKVAGDRSWRLRQYLKGTVYCQRCGERLGFGHSVGKTGNRYAYFFCLGRHRRRTDCDLPYLPADKVDAAVVDEWDTVTFAPRLIAETRGRIDSEFDELLARDRATLARQAARMVRLKRQRQKLLDAWMDDLIAKDDFAVRQDQLDKELSAAQRLIRAAEQNHQGLREQIDLCLQLLEQAGQLYRALPDDGRQTLNQVRYDKLHLDITGDGRVFVASRELTEIVEAVEGMADQIRTETGSRPLLEDLEASQQRVKQQQDSHHSRTSAFRPRTSSEAVEGIFREKQRTPPAL